MAKDPIPLVSFVARGLREGLSGEAIYRQIKGTELGVRRTTFLQVVGEVRAAFSNREHLMGVDPTLSPDPGWFTDWRAGTSGKFIYQVSIPIRQVGTDETIWRPYSATFDRMVTPSVAIDQAMDAYGDAAADYGEVLYGGVLTGLYRMVGRVSE